MCNPYQSSAAPVDDEIQRQWDATLPFISSQTCPFCDGKVHHLSCTNCGRNTRVTRRRCGGCQRFNPSSEITCIHCGGRFRSEYRWKIPVMVVVILIGILVQVAITIAENM